jgi:hypothetical protein
MKKFNTALLPYIGAFAQSVLFSFAGVQAFGAWGWFIGPGVGITASLAVATASSGIGSITSKGRKQLAQAGLFLMVIFSASTVSLSLAAPDSVWCAVSWGCAVDVSIVLAGAVSGKGLVASEPAISQTKPAKAERKPKVSEVEPAKLAFVCVVAGCTAKPFASQAALNAHQRKHKPVAYAVSTIEPVTKDMLK